ncbi:pentatricopeptide repeat-containing protein DOT4, chloroplastic-like [Selaginella moellendorffii]|uniref:pentatricopeptide repeat-containing protein DOT4, chloroplastic-like n=1 Tax=Selaginella moellendorffii TaxID=88036 RepID=UPI000D1C58BA|nr:pentatricopeptide repeat-containing protein DOT4, chloroplastic-like [Selaginella moellendorffii]|eukprot:XP_024519638.1 pentatricopeptide repeat-containing protein DOT4, chloroplastic-like [Selaginella moellendorffii]
MGCRNVVSWNSLILGHAENGEEDVALKLLEWMLCNNSCKPDGRTFLAAVKACTNLAVKEAVRESDETVAKVLSLEKGLAVHLQLTRCCKDQDDIFIANALVDMYAKCGSLADSERVFYGMKNLTVVTWTSLMLGYVDNGRQELALELFVSMANLGAVCPPNARTFVAVLKACTGMAEKEEVTVVNDKSYKQLSLEKGLALHSEAARRGCDIEVFVANTLVDMYSKCGSLEDASRVFYRMPHRNVVTYTALITGFSETGEAKLALELFSLMKRDGGCVPDSKAFAAVLKACGGAVDLQMAREAHAAACRRGLESDRLVANSVVDTYVTWTALIAGYARQGDTDRVLALFHEMETAGSRPNGTTFVSLLAAFSRAGLVDSGKLCFQAMRSRYGVDPGMEHYLCMVDLLARANLVEAAVETLERMPFKPEALAWRTVLGACQDGNFGAGKIAFESLVGAKGDHAAAYDLMANIHSCLARSLHR